MPRLSAVVMVGEKARRARSHLETTGLALFTSDHPSPLVRATFPLCRHLAVRSRRQPQFKTPFHIA